MDEKKKIKQKQTILMIIGIMILLVSITGITFAFFNYTKTGDANVLKVGNISFTTNQKQTISLTNLFPIDPTETGIMDDETKVGTLEIEITGNTTYGNGIEYLITTANSHVTSSGKVVPISLSVDIDEGLGNNDNNYFTNRNNKNANIYKRLTGDMIIGDQQLLVGYIKPDNGVGIDGSITIKAYIDKNNVVISDTYNENRIITSEQGTTSDWVDDRPVFTTEEWNALQETGVSFQVKIEANEGIWIDEPIYNKLRVNAVMDNIQSTNVSASTGIDFSKISGDTNSDNVIDNGEGLYVRAGTEDDAYPVVYYRGNIDNNNVYFGGYCWQIVRTTETGGIKMIYNGTNTNTLNSDEPKCEPAAGTDRQITLNINNEDKNIFTFSGTNRYNSIAYNGYTRNNAYSATSGDYESESKFGNGVIWDEINENYTITDISDEIDDNHHYTCGTQGATTCSSIRYYFSYAINGNTWYRYYFTLEGGKTIEDVVRESLENGTNDSNAKAMLNSWYSAWTSPEKSKIEDAIYCNDRSIYELGGMNPNGGALNGAMLYSGYKRNYVTFNPSTKCNRVADSYTLKTSDRGNKLLDYPVGLITIDELAMAGGRGTAKSNFYLKTGVEYWSLSPHRFGRDGSGATGFSVSAAGVLSSHAGNSIYGLRPVISLNSGTSIASGTGEATSPYIFK